LCPFPEFLSCFPLGMGRRGGLFFIFRSYSAPSLIRAVVPPPAPPRSVALPFATGFAFPLWCHRFSFEEVPQGCSFLVDEPVSFYIIRGLAAFIGWVETVQFFHRPDFFFSPLGYSLILICGFVFATSHVTRNAPPRLFLSSMLCERNPMFDFSFRVWSLASTPSQNPPLSGPCQFEVSAFAFDEPPPPLCPCGSIINGLFFVYPREVRSLNPVLFLLFPL